MLYYKRNNVRKKIYIFATLLLFIVGVIFYNINDDELIVSNTNDDKLIVSNTYEVVPDESESSITAEQDTENIINDTSYAFKEIEDTTIVNEKIKTFSGYELQTDETLLQSQVQQSDTISSMLGGLISYKHLNQLIKLVKPKHNLTTVRVNKKYQLVQDADGNFARFEYQKNSQDIFVLSVKDTQILNDKSAKVEDIYDFMLSKAEYEIKTETVEFEIGSNLHDAITKVGEKVSLALNIEKILSHNLDVSNSLKKGDIFKVLVEKKYDEQKFINYGNILAVSFERKGKNFAVYRFEKNSNQIAYYDANGKSLQSSFLEKPLNYTKISTPYTLARRHPILGIVRPHEGIDYAAPTGTPVYAVADATVNFVGYNGDFGKTVILKHANGMQTQYAHLSRYNAKTKKNAKVSKGDIIAYVGSTGLSTGPHLDFRVKKSGRYVNPKVLKSTKEIALTNKQKEEFLITISEYNVALNEL